MKLEGFQVFSSLFSKSSMSDAPASEPVDFMTSMESGSRPSGPYATDSTTKKRASPSQRPQMIGKSD